MVCGFVLMYYLDNHLQLSWVIIEENLPFLLDVMLFFYKKVFISHLYAGVR